MPSDDRILSRWARLQEILRGYGRVAVAFSGGVDSALLARAAVETLGERAIAVTAVSPSLAAAEREIARQQASEMGIRHREILTREFESPDYRANAGDRCFHCKSELYTVMERLLPELEVDVLCNGANLDDCGDHRPGMRAAEAYHVKSPLIEAGFTKDDVRALAHHFGMTIWDKPASPCLSSRIAYGIEVTPERVQRVEAAEQFLRDLLGLRELRVRLDANEMARIELPLADLTRLGDSELRTTIVQRFHQLGFRSVMVDLEGFRSGSLNAALPLVSLEIPGRAPDVEFA